MKLTQILILSSLLAACATSPLGRKQLILVSDAQMNELGTQAFSQMKTSQPVDSSPQALKYVQCIVRPLTEAARGQTPVENWEVVVFKDPSANAFALPGGKIGVHTGILKLARSDAQLAAVLGHEIGHVIARHGAERVSQQAGTQVGLQTLGVITSSNPHSKTLMGLLGLGTQVGILLPFSRAQESEADLIGLKLMAQVGFDPEGAVQLWENMMAAQGGKAPPQILSTHPANETRIQNLKAHMGEELLEYQKAKEVGKTPQCDRSFLRN